MSGPEQLVLVISQNTHHLFSDCFQQSKSIAARSRFSSQLTSFGILALVSSSSSPNTDLMLYRKEDLVGQVSMTIDSAMYSVFLLASQKGHFCLLSSSGAFCSSSEDI
ncbi:MAG: hypothetical protein RBU37_23875, partial [Myxococcota bacterium]|jgi:hypothetical protein|nr:hypothetical protein [Myxococcota bacterium]